MVKMRIAAIIIVLITLFALPAIGQDPHFSQFYAAPNYLGPSLAGSSGGTRFVANYRNQWPGITKTYQTLAFSGDMYINKYRSGFGLIMVSDKAGSAALTTNLLGMQYSYRVQLGEEWQFVPGLQFTLSQRSIDRNKLIFPDEVQNGYPSAGDTYLTDTKAQYVDFATSLFLYSPRLWFGLTADHLLAPNYTFMDEKATLPLKIVQFGGVNIWKQGAKRVEEPRTASLCYRFEYQNSFKQLDLGAYFFARVLDFGIWYRGLPVFNNKNAGDRKIDSDAIILMVGYSFGSFRIGYSYDIQLSSIAAYGAGAHEVSLQLEMGELFGCGAKYFDCFARRTGIQFDGDRPRKLKIF